MPRARAAALRGVAAAIADGRVVIDPGADRERAPRRAARAPGHRTVDRRVRADARGRRSGRVPRVGPRGAARARGARARRPSAGRHRTRRGLEPVARVRQRPPLGIGRNEAMSIRYSIYDGPEGPLLLARRRRRPPRPAALRAPSATTSRRAGSGTTPPSTPGARSSTSTSPGPAPSSTCRCACTARRSRSRCGSSCAGSRTARRSRTASSPSGSTGPRRRVPSARRTARTRSRSWCRVTA